MWRTCEHSRQIRTESCVQNGVGRATLRCNRISSLTHPYGTLDDALVPTIVRKVSSLSDSQQDVPQRFLCEARPALILRSASARCAGASQQKNLCSSLMKCQVREAAAFNMKHGIQISGRLLFSQRKMSAKYAARRTASP